MVNKRQHNEALVSPDDDHKLDANGLTSKQELFAQLWASCGNQAAAYRKAFNVRPDTAPGTVWASASTMAAKPAVRARYDAYREKALEGTITSIREMLQHDYDLATADPNDLVQTLTHNCRHCHGDDFKYQWKDDNEYIAACDVAIEAKVKTLPSDEGGYGFNPLAEPNPACPHCYGGGIPHVVIRDTTKLEGKARALYKGAKVNRWGEIEILMHDQAAAKERVCRILGAYKDTLDLRTPAERAAEAARNKIPDSITADDASRAYLDMLSTNL